MNDHVTYLFGLPGFDILDVGEIDGELHIEVERPRVATCCRSCGAGVCVKDRRWVTVRDLPACGRPVVLHWRKRVFACRRIACVRKCFTERSDAIASRALLTERARTWAFKQVGRFDATVSATARALGVSWGTVMAIVTVKGPPVIEDANRLSDTCAIGVDETAYLKACGKHPTVYVTGVVDMTAGRTPRLVDVVRGRSGSVLSAWLKTQPASWKAGIDTAALDPFRGYATALAEQLPSAVRVLDPFHTVKLAITCIDEVRRRVQQDTLQRRGHAGDPLYGIRRILRKRADRLTKRQHQRIIDGLTAGDPAGEINIAWNIGQQFMAAYHHPDRDAGKQLVVEAVDAARTCPVPEIRRLGRTLTRWMPELLAHFDHRDVSNGPTENLNLKIKNTKRAARGYRNFDNYRLRLLLNHGTIWKDQQPTRIRTRRPTIAA